MPLYDLWAQLETELDALTVHFRDFTTGKPAINSVAQFTLYDECLLEGLLSHVWQSWNLFCRECVMESCMGTADATGAVIGPIPDALSQAHVSGAAIVAKQQPRPPYWGTTNTLLRKEPTWGDADVLVNVLSRLQPNNSPKLLAAFSSVHANAKALQNIRNAAAHNHAQNMAEVQQMRSAYLPFPIAHPIHAIYWVEPQSNDFLITHAIEELKTAGLIAIS